MGREKVFRFKQFAVVNDRTAMKVGTDGVLLGAWCPVDGARQVLDVGTGCGVIALMIAQRNATAIIDAIDIDHDAIEEASLNFNHSPWGDRLTATECDFNIMAEGKTYDLIVSNPPYFQNSLKNPDKGRQTARHTDTLSFAELIKHSARLLIEDGQLALILPAEAENEIRQLAGAEGFFLTRVTRVYSKESKPARRVLMAFSRDNGITEHRYTEDTFVLEDEKGGRSLPYQELCRDFYL
jgi:tRNA1Val (adenine37-N6)-methyltransferase